VHLNHIVHGGDPFEVTTARPLDFGHWAAHKLEQMTRFRLRHGEAVAIGLALDVAYSALALELTWPEVERIHRCLADLGFALYDEAMVDTGALLQGLEEFREHLGGELTVTLLNGIGRAVEVHRVDPRLVLDALDLLATRAAGRLARPLPALTLQEAAAND
jgi:3-dehydroquinate synthase